MKTIRNLGIISLFLITALLHAQCIKGKGTLITKEFPVTEFQELNIGGSIDYILVDKKINPNVKVKTHPNLIELIEVKQKGAVLNIHIKNNARICSYKTFEVYIPVSTSFLSKVNHAGSGEMKSEITLSAHSLEINHSGSGEISTRVNTENLKTGASGSGEITLSGKANYVKMSLSGSGEISAKHLESNNVKVVLSGSGEIELNAKQSLKAMISGSGRIYYKGEPREIKKSISGSGKIVQIN